MGEPSTGLLVGRGRERAQLVSAMERGVAGDPGLVVVCGEAGIGKTALVEDLGQGGSGPPRASSERLGR